MFPAITWTFWTRKGSWLPCSNWVLAYHWRSQNHPQNPQEYIKIYQDISRYIKIYQDICHVTHVNVFCILCYMYCDSHHSPAPEVALAELHEVDEAKTLLQAPWNAQVKHSSCAVDKMRCTHRGRLLGKAVRRSWELPTFGPWPLPSVFCHCFEWASYLTNICESAFFGHKMNQNLSSLRTRLGTSQVDL